MKIKIVVGDVEVNLTGLDLSKRQVIDILREAAGIATLMSLQPSSDDEARPIGFTAHLDLDPERNIPEDLSEWFEESP